MQKKQRFVEICTSWVCLMIEKKEREMCEKQSTALKVSILFLSFIIKMEASLGW